MLVGVVIGLDVIGGEHLDCHNAGVVGNAIDALAVVRLSGNDARNMGTMPLDVSNVLDVTREVVIRVSNSCVVRIDDVVLEVLVRHAAAGIEDGNGDRLVGLHDVPGAIYLREIVSSIIKRGDISLRLSRPLRSRGCGLPSIACLAATPLVPIICNGVGKVGLRGETRLAKLLDGILHGYALGSLDAYEASGEVLVAHVLRCNAVHVRELLRNVLGSLAGINSEKNHALLVRLSHRWGIATGSRGRLYLGRVRLGLASNSLVSWDVLIGSVCALLVSLLFAREDIGRRGK